MTDESQRTKRPRLSQETIAIVTVGVALAGLILVVTGDLRDEGRASRAGEESAASQRMAGGEPAASQRMAGGEPTAPRRSPGRPRRVAGRDPEAPRRLPARDPPAHGGTGQARGSRHVRPAGERVGKGAEQHTTSEPTARAIELRLTRLDIEATIIPEKTWPSAGWVAEHTRWPTATTAEQIDRFLDGVEP